MTKLEFMAQMQEFLDGDPPSQADIDAECEDFEPHDPEVARLTRIAAEALCQLSTHIRSTYGREP